MGGFQPEGGLDDFAQEEMAGVWPFGVLSSSYQNGSVSSWSVTIVYDTSTPSDPPVIPGTEYSGSSFTITGDNVSTGSLTIGDNGTITDLNITMSGTYANISYIDFKLITPYGTIVDLVTTGWSVSAFEGTTFDDEASNTISSGSSP